MPYQRVFVNPLAADDPALREFAAASPLLEVPCLVDDDDGTAVFDSTTMLEYVEDKWPAPPPLPAARRARRRSACWPPPARSSIASRAVSTASSTAARG